MRIPAAIALFLVFLAGWGRAADEVIPPSPAHYFNDYAAVVSPAVANNLNRELEDFEKSTSSQLVVAIFPTMQTNSSIEDYAQRIFQAWKPGQKKVNNGAILLVFVKEHKMRIQTGYGLEGAMPDVICKRIIDDEIAPHLRANDFNAGMTAGVHAMMQAAQGEYKGTGRTVHQQQRGGRRDDGGGISWVVILLFFIIYIVIQLRRSRGTYMSSGGGTTYTTWGSGWGGGGGGGWSSGGGDSGGFSGGGGDSGGGGASGSW